MTTKKSYKSKICIGCKKIFNNSKSRTENEYSKQKFCTLKCFRRTGRKSRLKGSLSSSWKGGIQYHNGYRYVYNPSHPNAARDLYIAEHRLAMEKHLGRYLERTEYIHHINGNRLDNRVENLYLCENIKEHTKIHKMMDDFLFRLIQDGVVHFNVQERQLRLTIHKKSNHQ